LRPYFRVVYHRFAVDKELGELAVPLLNQTRALSGTQTELKELF
jgi:hypothetical protein